MTDQQIKTRADGTIDVDFYMNRGRLERSRTAHIGFRGIARALRKAIANFGQIDPSVSQAKVRVATIRQ